MISEQFNNACLWRPPRKMLDFQSKTLFGASSRAIMELWAVWKWTNMWITHWMLGQKYINSGIPYHPNMHVIYKQFFHHWWKKYEASTIVVELFNKNKKTVNSFSLITFYFIDQNYFHMKGGNDVRDIWYRANEMLWYMYLL